jgi:hypothetical protein
MPFDYMAVGSVSETVACYSGIAGALRLSVTPNLQDLARIIDSYAQRKFHV